MYDLNGQQIGTITRLIIGKVSGRVFYAIMKFGGLLGIGADEYAIPWNKLEYDTEVEGYRSTSPKSSSETRQSSLAIQITIGRTSSANATCMIIMRSPIIG